MTSLTHVEGNADLQVISLNKNKVLTCTGSSHWLKGLTLISAINLLVILQVCILFLLTRMYSQEISFLLLVSVCLLLDLAHILLNIKKIMKPCPFKSESYLHIFVLWSLAEKCFYRFFLFVFFTLLADGKHLLRWVWHVTESRSETPLPSHLLL